MIKLSLLCRSFRVIIPCWKRHLVQYCSFVHDEIFVYKNIFEKTNKLGYNFRMYVLQ